MLKITMEEARFEMFIRSRRTLSVFYIHALNDQRLSGTVEPPSIRNHAAMG